MDVITPGVPVPSTTISPTARVTPKLTVTPIVMLTTIRPTLKTANSDSNVGSNGAIQTPVIAAVVVVVVLVVLLALYVFVFRKKESFSEWCQQPFQANNPSKSPEVHQTFKDENPLFRQSQMRQSELKV